ncbi:Esterase [Fusarium oxysporum f. sp. albedinis]|nr:Esterase [Fusarium oxysporum f. sp. albedinis]
MFTCRHKSVSVDLPRPVHLYIPCRHATPSRPLMPIVPTAIRAGSNSGRSAIINMPARPHIGQYSYRTLYISACFMPAMPMIGYD